MATWHFDFHLVPRSELERRFGDTPLTVSEADYRQSNWWTEAEATSDLIKDLSSVLPEGRSWNSEQKTWGASDSDRLTVILEDHRVAEVSGRVDVRHLSLAFLNRIIAIARRHGLLILTEGRYILRPSVRELLAAIQRSPSFAFVADPEEFLNRLAATDEQ